MNNIQVAVVTVTYNAEKTIARTIKSVLTQNYVNIEYWIVDGCSTDGTLEIANSYKQEFEKTAISYNIISKKDNGIFDAMNSSLYYISSDFVLFLNSGDFLCDENTISSVFKDKEVGGYDIIYGDFYSFIGNWRKLQHAKNYNKLPESMVSSHQAIFTKVDLLQNRPYDCSYKMAADYDFYLEMFLLQKKFKKINIPIVYFDIDGISQVRSNITQKERLRLQYSHGCISKRSYIIRTRLIWMVSAKKKIIKKLPKFVRLRQYELFGLLQ